MINCKQFQFLTGVTNICKQNESLIFLKQTDRATQITPAEGLQIVPFAPSEFSHVKVKVHSQKEYSGGAAGIHKMIELNGANNF